MAEQEANAERIRVYRSAARAKALPAKLPDIPMAYLAATQIELPPNWPVADMRTLIRSKQREFVDLFPQGQLVPVDSGHQIPDDVAAEHITRILDRAATGAP